MPGDNCSIRDCKVSRSSKYKGISLFKIPSGDSECDTIWRNKLVDVITKDREIDSLLRERIKLRKLFICQRHYREDQYYRHDVRATLEPGAIPTLNLPIKSFPSSSSLSKPRDSSKTVLLKRSLSAENVPDTPPPSCYKSFTEFNNRVTSLKLVGWQVNNHDNVTHFTLNDQTHSVPKYEIYVDDQLSFTVRVLLWNIPNGHEIYSLYQRSLNNVTVTNLINDIIKFNICPGALQIYSGSCIEHSVPKIFSLSDSSLSPLCQTKWYRSPTCRVLVTTLDKCQDCLKTESKENVSLKRKRENLTSPAKLKAPISLTSPERIKLTLQNYRLENKQLKEQIAIMREEISKKSLPIDNELGKDLISIMSNNNTQKVL